MAQLKDTTIYGVLNVDNNIILQENEDITDENGQEYAVSGIHPENKIVHKMLHMSKNGNTVVGYGSYANADGSTHIYGNDVAFFIKSIGSTENIGNKFIPYYRVGDEIDFDIQTSGFVTTSGTRVKFIVPLTKPIVGNPTIIATSNNGFVLRQNNNYTHGSNVADNTTTYTKPTSYSVDSIPSGIVITAIFDNTTNVTNNDSIGVHWSGKITLS